MKNNFQSKSVPRGTRTIWRYLGALFLLFTFAIGNVLAATGDAEIFSFAWTSAGTKGYAYSQAGPTGGVLLADNKIYFVSNEGPKVDASKLNPYRVGFVFKPTTNVKLKIKGSAGSSARTIQSIKIDEEIDSRFYTLCANAEGSAKTVMQYALDNASATDKEFYSTVGILKVSKGVYSVAGDAKSASGQTAQSNLYAARVSAANISIAANKEAEAVLTTGSPAVEYMFEAGKCYRVYTEVSSSTGAQLISFTFVPVYQLSWALDGGTITSAADAYTKAGYYAKGTELTAPTVAKGGADFAGWSPAVAATMPAAATTYTATWATACSAGVPGNVTKGALTAGEITLTAEGSAASGDTWYWQTSESGVDKTNAGSSFVATAAGTYYVRSYNTAADCWNVTAKSIELTAEDFLATPTATFSAGAYVVGAAALDLSGLWSSNSDGAVTYALKEASDDASVSGTSFTATKAGSYVVTASQEATATYNAIVKEATITVTWPATGAADVLFNIATGTGNTALGTASKEAHSASINTLSDFAAAGGLVVSGRGAGKDGLSTKLETLSEKDADKYIYVSFKVADGYIFTINSVTTKVVAVSTAKTIEVALSDATTNEALSYNQGKNSSAADHEFEFSGKAYEGTITLKIYAYGATDDYRLAAPLTISGTVAVKPSPAAPSISAPTADSEAEYDLNDVITPLSITATGYPTPTYQWYSNSSASTEGATAIEGAQSASYTPANDVASDLYYYCVATNSQGSATSHYFHVAVKAPTVPTIYTETTALTLTSNKVATASETFTFSGANLGETAVTLVLASAVDGLTLSEASVAPTAGAITDKEITVSYKSLLDVTPADVNLYLKQGDDILHTIALTYSSTAGIEDLTSISAATTWNWDGAADAAFGTLDQNAMIVLANADVTWDAGFNALAIAGKLQHYYRDSKYAQGHELKFNTTIPGRVTVTFSNTGGKDIARAPRITDVNGTYAPTAEEDGSKNTTAKTYSHNVAAGDVLIAGFEMQTGTPANMLRYYKVEFVPTYTVAYAANGGSGDMTDANAYVAGDEVTLLANTFTPASGFVWSGWAVTKTASGDPIEVSEGKFTMPAEAVTVTAQWDDASKIVKIVETGEKYESLAAAVAAATDGQTIQLLQNVNVTAQVEVAEKAITLDLAGHKIEYTGTSTLSSGVLLVHNGASLTINDSSDPDAGSIVAGEKAYAAIALTKAGDDATNPAVLTINGGIFTGLYYAITGHGSRHNTTITINNGTFTATAANDNNAIYHPQEGTLTINNGTFTGYLSAIEMRAGTLVINNGTFTATASTYKCDPNGSGTTTVGAAIAIAQHNTQKDLSVTINGGTFEGVKAINEANPQGNPASAIEKIDIAIKGGDFTGAVSTVDVDHFISGGTFDAPVAQENCAVGYVPSPQDPGTGKYGVLPKDGTSLIKAVATAKSQDIEGANLTGVFKGAAHIETSDDYKMDTKKYFMVQLVAGQNFQAGDIVKINVSAVNDCNGFTIYSDIESDGNFIPANLIIDTHDGTGAAAKVSAGINEVKLPEAFAGSNKLYVGRASGADKYLNAGINQVEVTRAMNPQLVAITIDGRDGVINEANKTVAVTIPYDADLAALAVVPTIAWNAAAAENSIVVNDGAAWTEGDNTYKLTDKDGDYTVYTITLTRDVQKFVVTYFDGETNLGTEEVEKNGHPTATGIVAPTKKGKIFLGWNQSSTATAAEDLNDITITAVKNLYAIYEDIDCSGTGVKFSMTPKANELTENYEPKGNEERDYAEYATLVGGKVFINNVDASNKRISVLKETSHIKFEGGDDGYIHVELDCPLNEKDTIKIENDQKWQVSVAKGSGYVAKAKVDKYHVVPAAWDGKYDFYIKRDGSSLTISGIQVVRPAKFDVSFNMMGHGTQIADIEDVIEGSKITAPTAPTDEDYTFEGWYKETELENEWDFDNDVVVANTTLFAKWLDKSDATLKSLKYGDTEIALEAGEYTYNVNVSALVSGVPALTAVTNNPAATAVVTDDDAFDGEGKATSTVEVTPEKEGAAHQTYTVKFTKLPLYTDIVDVTGYTEWSWAGVATAEVKINDVANRGVILANYIDAPNFEMLAGQENARAYRNNSYPAYQGTYLKFHATVPGRLTIKARNSSGSPILRVNGIDLATLNSTPKDYITAVPEGDVEITSSADEFRIYAMTFDPAVDYTRDVTEGKYGTICLPTNGVMIGTTIYTLAFYGATSQKIFFDEVVTGRMEAGKPYLFLPKQGVTELKVFYTDSETKAAQAVNGFHGYIGDSEDPEDALQVEAGVGNYIVQNNTYREVQTGATAYILSHRAYINFSEITTTEPAKAPGARRIGLGKDAAQGFENLQSGDQPMKVMIDGTLYIIRGEKVYNANGQVVK